MRILELLIVTFIFSNMFIPIIIHIKEKSDKEIREEMARERRWRELMEKKDQEKKRRIEEAERKKLEEKQRKEKELDEWWFDLVHSNEWETQFLPEGWSIFGQTNIQVLNENNVTFSGYKD